MPTEPPSAQRDEETEGSQEGERKLTGSKTIEIELPENIHRILMGMALDGEADPAAWIARYISDAVKQDLKACLDSTSDNPVFDPAKARWALSKQ